MRTFPADEVLADGGRWSFWVVGSKPGVMLKVAHMVEPEHQDGRRRVVLGEQSFSFLFEDGGLAAEGWEAEPVSGYCWLVEEGLPQEALKMVQDVLVSEIGQENVNALVFSANVVS